MGFPQGTSPHGLRGGWGACSMKLIITFMENINKPQDYKKKQQKRTHFDVSDISCSDDEQKYKLVSSSFPEYITTESKEKTPITSMSPFIIEKILFANISPNMVKIFFKKTKHSLYK